MNSAQELFAAIKLQDGASLSGRFQEVTLFGVQMCRVDIPHTGNFDDGHATHFYAGNQIAGLCIANREQTEATYRPIVPIDLNDQGGGPDAAHTPDPSHELDAEKALCANCGRVGEALLLPCEMARDAEPLGPRCAGGVLISEMHDKPCPKCGSNTSEPCLEAQRKALRP